MEAYHINKRLRDFRAERRILIFDPVDILLFGAGKLENFHICAFYLKGSERFFVLLELCVHICSSLHAQ